MSQELISCNGQKLVIGNLIQVFHEAYIKDVKMVVTGIGTSVNAYCLENNSKQLLSLRTVTSRAQKLEEPYEFNSEEAVNYKFFLKQADGK